ncbi:MAG: hypothetical protein IPN10_00225 [Saprospiraceae bacterium]|nr:hypothetical protein [Saprospiraceae bacterium]
MGVVRLFLSVLLFLMSFLLSAQPWVESGLDANGNPNFLEYKRQLLSILIIFPSKKKVPGIKPTKDGNIIGRIEYMRMVVFQKQE